MSKLSELKIEYRDSAYEFFKQHLGDAYKAKRKAFNFKYKLTQYFIGERVRPILTDITHGCLDLEATQKQSYKTG